MLKRQVEVAKAAKAEQERQAKAAADAEPKRKAAEAEATATQAAKAPAVVSAAPREVAEPLKKEQQQEQAGPVTQAAVAAAEVDNERKAQAQATGGDNEIKKMEQARQALERLPKGKIVLDAPKAMKVGDTRAVYANVGINVPIELLRKHNRPTDQSHEAVLSVSSEMAATLTGPGFAITATTPEQQGVAEGFPTIWSWNVEAKQDGEQELEATLYVLLPTRQRIDSFTHKIGVTVREQTWAEWLKSSRDEMDAIKAISVTLGGAGMAVLGWLRWSYSRRRKIEDKGTAALSA
jgi:hypothetical protein